MKHNEMIIRQIRIELMQEGKKTAVKDKEHQGEGMKLKKYIPGMAFCCVLSPMFYILFGNFDLQFILFSAIMAPLIYFLASFLIDRNTKQS